MLLKKKFVHLIMPLIKKIKTYFFQEMVREGM